MTNLKKLGLIFLILGIIFATSFFIKSNKKDITKYEITQLKKQESKEEEAENREEVLMQQEVLMQKDLLVLRVIKL